VGILATEALLCWKYREDTGHIIMDAVTPAYIYMPWIIGFSSILIFWLYLRFKKGHTIKYPLDAKKSQVKKS
jgi:hypothetical protein